MADLDTCTVVGPVVAPDGTAIDGGTIVFTLTRRDVDGNVTIVPRRVEATIDENGDFEAELWPNVAGLAGTQYMVRVTQGQITWPSWRATIPDLASVSLAAVSENVPPEEVDDLAAAVASAQENAYIAAENAQLTAQDAVSTAADVVLTHADVVLTHADAVATAADLVQTGLDRIATGNDAVATAADVVLTHADVVLTHADAAATAADRVATNADVLLTHADAAATTADRVQTGLDVAATAADRIQTGADVLTTAANRDVSTADKDAAAISADEAEAAAAGAIVTKGLMDTALENIESYDDTLGQLSPAAKEVVAAADVVDVFIYDTTLDSDGGAWRKRCNWTSWFKETLNTATRGARNQFPSKALIVARPGSVTIYDLDQASCPMWMVFSVGSGNGWWASAATPTSVAALNGQMIVGSVSVGYRLVDFVTEKFVRAFTSATTAHTGGIAARNSALAAGSETGPVIVNGAVNDVAATVLPGTPIDRRRRLPTPCVAVATAGGVSVIHWDGRVANSSATASYDGVGFDTAFRLTARSTSSGQYHEFSPPSYQVSSFSPSLQMTSATVPALLGYATGVAGRWARYASGLSALSRAAIPGSSAVAYLTSKYSTGYMVGDTKLALAESTADLTSLVQGATDYDSGADLASNGGFDSDTVWTKGVGWTIAAGVATHAAGTGSAISQGTATAGKKYRVTWTVSGATAGTSWALVGGAAGGAQAGNGAFSTVVTAVAAQAIGIQCAAAFDGSIDNVSIKEVVTTVLYEDFGGYADVPAMVAAGWGGRNPATGNFDNTVSTGVSLTGGRLRISTVGGNNRWVKPITTVVGQTYRLSGKRYIGTDGAAGISVVPTFNLGGAALADSYGFTDNTAVSVTFVATTTTCHVMLRAGYNVGGYVEFDDIRIDVVASDRSVAGNHPLVYGTVTRTAVATGAELAAYGGFSDTNYLELSGTPIAVNSSGVLVIHGQVYLDSVSAVRGLMTLRSDSGGLEITTSASGVLRVFAFLNSSPGSNVAISASVACALNTWHSFAVARSGTTIYLYLDGNLVATQTGITSAWVDWSTNPVLYIGRAITPISGNAVGSKIANLRITQTMPTPQQFRDMYAVELPLFQPNAKCLLPNDSVSALAYDDSTDLLHVATTSGMARLKDLLVVDKDAIVVTGIDARSGIVVTRDANSADAVLPAKLLREELLAPQSVALYDRDKVKGSGVTTNATPTVIGRIPFDKGECKIVDVRVKGNQGNDGAAYGRYVRRALVDRPEEGNIALGGSVEVMGTDAEGTSTQDIGLTVNTTTQTLDITATGLATTNIEWTWEAVLS